jgi:hypothetical protein
MVRAPLAAESLPLPEGDGATAKTIEQMVRLIEAGKKDQVVNRTAAAIVKSLPPFNRLAEANAVYRWVLGHIRFTSDTKGVELLRSPAETLAVGVGDCDDFVILICALLGTVGHSLRIVTVASDPRDSSVFTHVYPEDFIRGRWVALDAARRGAALGKRPARIYRVRVWQMDGSYFDLDPREYLTEASGGDARAFTPAAAEQSTTKHWKTFSALEMSGLRGGVSSELGFLAQDDFATDVAALTPAIAAGTTGAANIIRASNMPALPYGYGYGAPPGVQSASFAASGSMMPLILIGGLIAIVMVMRR